MNLIIRLKNYILGVETRYVADIMGVYHKAVDSLHKAEDYWNTTAASLETAAAKAKAEAESAAAWIKKLDI